MLWLTEYSNGNQLFMDYTLNGIDKFREISNIILNIYIDLMIHTGCFKISVFYISSGTEAGNLTR